jgi:large subunit ribosomal protein L6
MSRIGRKPILIPEGVEVKIDGQKVTVKGPKGEFRFDLPLAIQIAIKENKIFLSPLQKTKELSALWGTTRSILSANIKGVIEGYEKKLEIEGLGFRAQVEGEDTLVLYVGFTHPVKIKTPEGIKFSVEKNIITVSGINKELVSRLAAKIKMVRVPDPYKAKGIKYVGEVIRKKAGKKVVTTTK